MRVFVGVIYEFLLSGGNLLERCFVVKVCHSYAKNLSNELKKSKKIYFCDTGIRNAVIEDFSPLVSRADAGVLWENFFFIERVKFHSLRRDYARIYFWRTSGRQPREIDFVEVIDNKMRAFECKLSEKAKSRSHEIFTKAYPDCTVDVVGWGAKSGLGNPGVQALGAHSEQLE